MTKKKYIDKALRTEFKDFKHIEARLSKRDTMRIVHAIFGLAGEVGELVDIFKRYIFYGKDIDWNHVLEELGDLEWYTAPIYNIAGKALGIDDSSLAAMIRNIKKLRVRFPDAFKESDALNRNLIAENKVLHKRAGKRLMVKLSRKRAGTRLPKTRVAKKRTYLNRGLTYSPVAD